MEAIPFLSLSAQHDRIRDELEKSFKKLMKGGTFILGEEVKAFEKEYAAYTGVNHCVGVANGLDALYISLKVSGIGPGDEVIVPALTCSPTWMAVCRIGAVPVPVDAKETSFNIDEAAIKTAMSSKTKAIIPVNLYGRPADLSSILSTAKSSSVVVIEDNAQAHGASVLGKQTGSFGLINATSFYPTKNLGALGDGGAITTNDQTLAEKARQLRNYGTTQRFQSDVIGINSRLDEMQAALLRIKLGYLDEWNEERRKLASVLEEMLSGVGDITLPQDVKGAYSVFHLFVMCTNQRTSLRKFLLDHGIETDIHYPIPPHLQKAFAYLGHEQGKFPVAEKISQTIVSLPLWPGMDEQQIEYVGNCVREFFG